ncbi:MAG: MBL fold metallo-hydrolase [Firmicutes bacterium]|nr:MBL fold metallo-hydrolase [Bacillota bacterium]
MQFFTIASSSSGNCSFVAAGKTKILIDTGIFASRIRGCLREQKIRPQDIDAILVTHEHSDHVKWLPQFCEPYRVPVYAVQDIWPRLDRFVEELPLKHLRPLEGTMQIGDIRIRTFDVPHDAPTRGFIISAEGKRLGYLTDCGHVTPHIYRNLLGRNNRLRLDALMVEANFDRKMLWRGPYRPMVKRRIAGDEGHLSNNQTARLLDNLLQYQKPFPVMLLHLSETNNTPELAYAKVAEVIRRHGGDPEQLLTVAPARGLSRVWNI